MTKPKHMMILDVIMNGIRNVQVDETGRKEVANEAIYYTDIELPYQLALADRDALRAKLRRAKIQKLN